MRHSYLQRTGHRPWYVSQKASSQCTTCQKAFENILYNGGVDVVIHGHVHVYERSAPVVNGTVDPNGYNNPRAPVYIVTGAAG